jgi:hypothetical protein
VRDYKVIGIDSYSKMVERCRQDLPALHAAAEAALRINSSSTPPRQ